MNVKPNHVAKCDNCDRFFPTVELGPRRLALVQPIPCISLGPGQFKIQPPDGTTVTPQEILGMMLEHRMTAQQTLPAFIPHDFVCPGNPEAPLTKSLELAGSEAAQAAHDETSETLDFIGEAMKKLEGES